MGRGGWNSKKTTLESCQGLKIKAIKPYLHPGTSGSLSWSNGNAINYQVTGSGDWLTLRLIYTLTRNTGEIEHLDYSVLLESIPTPWGARRWFFICKLSVNGRFCGRRVAALYRPGGQAYFGCRHCYNLAYRSTQEEHSNDRFNALLAGLIPGMTPADMRYLMREERGKPPRGYYERAQARALAELAAYEIPDPYAHYLTRADLLEQSGLTLDDLATLESCRLLLPDHEGKYRPKLAGWGGKLCYLLRAGWSLDELQAWARGRWKAPNPRQWPPTREDWQDDSGGKL